VINISRSTTCWSSSRIHRGPLSGESVCVCVLKSMIVCGCAILIRVRTPPGKSWIFYGKISRPWKVLENRFGPGKSVLEILVQGPRK